MQVFISWSGDRSRAVASAFRDWLPLVIQAVRPWFSPDDIEKGARWLADLNGQLEKQSVALLCITPESVAAPWLLFEAGALSKAIEASSVCPVVLGMEPTDIQGPLAQFQTTRTTKDDIRKLLATINRRLSAPLSETQLDRSYELLWPELEGKIQAIGAAPSGQVQQHRAVPEMLSEILARIRAVERQVAELRARDDASRRRGGVAGVQQMFRVKKFEQRVAEIGSGMEAALAARSELDQRLAALESESPEREELMRSRDEINNRIMSLKASLDETRGELEVFSAAYRPAQRAIENGSTSEPT